MNHKPPERPLLYAMLVHLYFPDDPTWQIFNDDVLLGKVYKVYEYRAYGEIVNMDDGRIRKVELIGVKDEDDNWGYIPMIACYITEPPEPIEPTKGNLQCH